MPEKAADTGAQRVLVIAGSGRGDSNTKKAVEELSPFKTYEYVELLDLDLRHYDYDHHVNQEDDFKMLIEKVRDSDVLIVASPVYWYSVSGRIKIFFDRFSELLSTYKPIGKELKGKEVWLIAQGWGEELPAGFDSFLKLTSEYFGMEYRGYRYKSQKLARKS